MHRFLILLAPFALAAPRPDGDNSITPTPIGFQLASEYLSKSLNHSVDPCDDFFEYSCGLWKQNNPIPSHLTTYHNFAILREKLIDEMRGLFESKEQSSSRYINELKKIYAKCNDLSRINELGARPMLDVIKTFGHFPMVHNELWHARDFDLTSLLINIASRGADVFIEIGPGTDIKNVTRRLLHFDQGSLLLGQSSREYYLNKSKFAKQMTALRSYLVKKVELITLDAGMPVNLTKIAHDVDEMLDFEVKFAAILVPDEDRRDFTKLYNVRRLSDIQNLMPLIDWERYFRALMPFSTHFYLDSNPEVVVADPKFLVDITELLRETDPRIITNYMMVRLTGTFSMELGDKYDDAQQDFAKTMYGRQQRAPRWKQCVASATGNLLYASGAMYVRRHFDQASKQVTVEMIDDLQESFREIITANDWMDATTKDYALLKAKSMLRQIGYPDFILDDEKLDNWYKGMEFKDNMEFGATQLEITRWTIDFFYKRLIETVDRTEFGSGAAVVNAFYSSIKNAIIFPAGILQAPFFHHTFPKALNYGGIGAVIGHEITHGFDDQGSQFAADGNLLMWWQKDTREKFVEKAQCIIKQYGDIEVPETGLKINGKLTQGENIADNGGVKQAYRAYKRFLQKHGPEGRIPGMEQYTNEQMFFLGYAQVWCGHAQIQHRIQQLLTDPHSPDKYRVNVVLSNQPEFAEAFQCKAGSKMNPNERCSVW